MILFYSLDLFARPSVDMSLIACKLLIRSVTIGGVSMINEVYNHKINACDSVIVMDYGTCFEICIMDYNAICCRPAMIITEGVLLWEYAPTFDNAEEAIIYVRENISNFI